jgi:hypothetical protein
MRAILGLLALATTSCTLDFQHFLDGAVLDGGPTGCPTPTLLVPIEHVQGAGAPEIRRYTITASGATQCFTLRGHGQLPDATRALAVLPSGQIAVASTNSAPTVIVDPATDMVVQSFAGLDWLPIDIFPLQLPDGRGALAVAYGVIDSGNGDYTIRTVHVIPVAGGAASDYDVAHGSPLLGLEVSSMSQHPERPTHLIAVRQSDSAALEVDLSNPPAMGGGTRYIVAGGAHWYRTVYALGPGQIAWTGLDNGATPTTEGVFYVASTTGTSGPPGGPVHCSPCQHYIHAVPDPTRMNAFFAVCEDTTGAQQLVRFATTDTQCQMIATVSQQPVLLRMGRMAVQP